MERLAGNVYRPVNIKSRTLRVRNLRSYQITVEFHKLGESSRPNKSDAEQNFGYLIIVQRTF